MNKLYSTLAAGLIAHTALAQTGRVGIGTITPLARLHVTDSSVLFSATGDVPANATAIPFSGTGRRTMWYPDKAAFRTGYVNGLYWDKDSTGNYSFASGYNTTATGPGSAAFGNLTHARGPYSMAGGAGATASGYAAMAGGENTTASANYSVAQGQATVASGQAAFVTGMSSVASGTASISGGFGNGASGDYSTAFGQASQAATIAATAIGFNDTASGYSATALGGGTLARSWGEVAVGTYNEDYASNGFNTILDEDRAFVVGNGSNQYARSNAITVLKNGNTGIGTSAPNATLAVKGSMSVNYNAVTATSYVLSDDDYFVAYTNTAGASGVFNLPPAQSGADNYKGRVYRIANYSGGQLSVMPSGSELVHGGASMPVPASTVISLISTGALSGITWMMTDSTRLPLLPSVIGTAATDNIRAILLATSGMASGSVGLYDAAANTEWVPINAAEYTALRNSLPGAVAQGASNTAMTATGAAAPISCASKFYTISMDTITQFKLPASNYPVAIHFKTGSGSGAALNGAKFMANNAALAGPYSNVGSRFTAKSVASNTDAYFVQKLPAFLTAAGNPSYFGFLSQHEAIGRVSNAASGMRFGYVSAFGTCNTPSTPNTVQSGVLNTYPLIQVLTTPTKSW